MNGGNIEDKNPQQEWEIPPLDLQLRGFSCIHLRNVAQKVHNIIQKKHVLAGFESSYFFVASESNKSLYLVKRKGPRKYLCNVNNCLSFKQANICSHVLAASHIQGDLQETVLTYNKICRGSATNLTTILMHSLPKGAGKKSGQVRHRKVPSAVTEVVPFSTTTSDPTPPDKPITMTIRTSGGSASATRLEIPEDEVKHYKLKFMCRHPRVQVSSGCKRKFAKDPGNKPPPPPHNLIIQRQEYHQYVEQHTGIL